MEQISARSFLSVLVVLPDIEPHLLKNYGRHLEKKKALFNEESFVWTGIMRLLSALRLSCLKHWFPPSLPFETGCLHT